MYTISSNHRSHDQQVSDALDWLRLTHPIAYSSVRKHFPETLRWSGPWMDTDAMDVDCEWSSWLCDAIKETGLVRWIDGEPWAGPFDNYDDKEIIQ